MAEPRSAGAVHRGLDTSPDRPGPFALDGVRIVSLAEQYPGPYATLLLADLGADVILVERPGTGDPTRQFPAFFDALNRNKRSIVLDLKTDDGREKLLRLVRTSDVLLEGYRPGTAERLGVHYERVAAVKSDIVYVSVSGFGQEGPYRDRPGHDLSYQALAGLFDDGHGRLRAATPGLAVADLSAGMFAALAILVGLVNRERTSRGSYIDVSMFDGLISWMTASLVPVINGIGPPGFPHDPAYAIYESADGQLVALAIVHEDAFWDSLCAALGMPEEAGLSSVRRLADRKRLTARISNMIRSHDMNQLEVALTAADVPFGRVNTLASVADDRHLAARQLIARVPSDCQHAERRYIRQPLKILGLEGSPLTHAPGLGEHTGEILEDISSSARAGDTG